MNREQLIIKLNEIKVKATQYSLYGDLLPDRIVLYNSYNDWVVFYLDERGNRRDQITFSSENEACNYIYEEFKDLNKYEL